MDDKSHRRWFASSRPPHSVWLTILKLSREFAVQNWAEKSPAHQTGAQAGWHGPQVARQT